MATMTWASTYMPLPDVEGIEIDDQPIAAGRRMASGVLRADYTTAKARITVRWPKLTAAERTTLLNRYSAADAAELTLPDGQSFTLVIAIMNPWRERQWWDGTGTARYDVVLTFEEV